MKKQACFFARESVSDSEGSWLSDWESVAGSKGKGKLWES